MRIAKKVDEVDERLKRAMLKMVPLPSSQAPQKMTGSGTFIFRRIWYKEEGRLLGLILQIKKAYNNESCQRFIGR